MPIIRIIYESYVEMPLDRFYFLETSSALLPVNFAFEVTPNCGRKTAFLPQWISYYLIQISTFTVYTTVLVLLLLVASTYPARIQYSYSCIQILSNVLYVMITSPKLKPAEETD